MVQRLDAFPRNRSKRDGRGSYCRGCAAKLWQARKRKHARQVLLDDLPGQPRFGNQGRPRVRRAKGRTLDALLEEW